MQSSNLCLTFFLIDLIDSTRSWKLESISIIYFVNAPRRVNINSVHDAPKLSAVISMPMSNWKNAQRVDRTPIGVRCVIWISVRETKHGEIIWWVLMVVRRTLDDFKPREKVCWTWSICEECWSRVCLLVKPPEKIVPVAAASQVNGVKKPKKLTSVKWIEMSRLYVVFHLSDIYFVCFRDSIQWEETCLPCLFFLIRAYVSFASEWVSSACAFCYIRVNKSPVAFDKHARWQGVCLSDLEMTSRLMARLFKIEWDLFLEDKNVCTDMIKSQCCFVRKDGWSLRHCLSFHAVHYSSLRRTLRIPSASPWNVHRRPTRPTPSSMSSSNVLRDECRAGGTRPDVNRNESMASAVDRRSAVSCETESRRSNRYTRRRDWERDREREEEYVEEWNNRQWRRDRRRASSLPTIEKAIERTRVVMLADRHRSAGWTWMPCDNRQSSIENVSDVSRESIVDVDQPISFFPSTPLDRTRCDGTPQSFAVFAVDRCWWGNRRSGSNRTEHGSTRWD